jgi:hypothetical protein
MLGYAAPSTFAWTLVSLALDAARESICIDNRTVMYDDYSLTVQLGSALPTIADQLCMYIYFAADIDGTNFTGNATGADAAITLGTNPFFGPFAFPLTAGTVWYDCTIPSVATFFGGIIPPRWSVILDNQCNGAFMGTEPTKYVRGIFYTT